MIRILHLIPDMGRGGAEVALLRVIAGSRKTEFEHAVLTLKRDGDLLEQVSAAGGRVVGSVRGAATEPWRRIRRLRADVRAFDPQVIQGWMYHANLEALFAVGAERRPVVWSIHHALHRPEGDRMTTRLARWLGARLSRRPARIHYSSRTSARQHEAIGYAAGRAVVIPNGYDTAYFAPDAARGAALRTVLGIPAGAPLVGMVGRVFALKGHANFAAAAERVSGRLPAAHFVCVGRGVPEEPALRRAAAALGGRLHLMGERGDMPAVYGMLDVLALPSLSESFPNAVAEAMACGVPCAVTDVGDAAYMVADTGRVVPARDAEALAAAIEGLLALPAAERMELGQRARARIQANFEASDIARRWDGLYRELVTGG